MTKRLELVRYRLIPWNRFEVGNIFKWLEEVEAEIVEL